MERFTFRRQLKNRGCYAEIEFDIIILEDDKNSIEVECHCMEWEVSVKSAAAIFYDYFRRLKTGSVQIIVYDISWYPVDTNNLIVLFSCLKGFTEAAGITLDNLKLDADSETFWFPEVSVI